MQDYLKQINNSKDIQKIATLIRAFGCRIAADPWNPIGERLRLVERAERDAQDIERCESIQQARGILRKQGYLYPKAERKRPEGHRYVDAATASGMYDD